MSTEPSMTLEQILQEAYRIGYDSRVDRPAACSQEYLKLSEVYARLPFEQRTPLEMIRSFNRGRADAVVDDALRVMHGE